MNSELVAMLDYLERDRGLDREVLVQVIEEALEGAAKKAVGPANELRVHLNQNTGEIQAISRLKVVEQVTEPHNEISLHAARMKHPNVTIGETIDWEVTPKNFGRIAAQTAKQGILHRLKQAEKERVNEDYSNRIGEIMHGTITRFDKGDIIINFGRTEAVLPYSERVSSEDYQEGDHICCVLRQVNPERQGPILVVSRSHPSLVQRLFEREVAEISEKIVEIKAVAREPGFRSKIAVTSADPNVDPVGACVGLRGARVKAIVRELEGEKVDIVPWDADIRVFVTNAMQPAKIKSLDIDEDRHQIIAWVDQDQLPLAIGKRGQNARLAVKLTGWKIDIREVTAEPKEADNFQQKVKDAVEQLAGVPGIDQETATQLVGAGFLTLEGIIAAEETDLAGIEGIDAEAAAHIKKVATAATQ